MKPAGAETEDERGEREGREYGKANIKAYCDANPEALAALIGIHADGHAEELLAAMREDFWSRSWTETPRFKLTEKALRAALSNDKPAPHAPLAGEPSKERP